MQNQHQILKIKWNNFVRNDKTLSVPTLAVSSALCCSQTSLTWCCPSRHPCGYTRSLLSGVWLILCRHL